MEPFTAKVLTFSSILESFFWFDLASHPRGGQSVIFGNNGAKIWQSGEKQTLSPMDRRFGWECLLKGNPQTTRYRAQFNTGIN